MKKGLAVILVIAVVIIALFAWCKNTYNGLVSADENVKSAWAQVENVYQRRADLIPNLVATVKGYAEHESSTLESVIAARAKATQSSVNPDNLTEENISKFQSAQGELGNAIGRLLVSVERYPDLKASQNFLELQSQLEGTENRISTERMKFNDVAKSYNTMIRSFPKNIIASMFNFEPKGYFKATEGTETAPKVEF